MAPAKRPDKMLLFFPWGIIDGGLFITHSVTLSNTSKICSLWWTKIQILQADTWNQSNKVHCHGHTRSSGSWFHAWPDCGIYWAHACTCQHALPEVTSAHWLPPEGRRWRSWWWKPARKKDCSGELRLEKGMFHKTFHELNSASPPKENKKLNKQRAILVWTYNLLVSSLVRKLPVHRHLNLPVVWPGHQHGHYTPIPQNQRIYSQNSYYTN